MAKTSFFRNRCLTLWQQVYAMQTCFRQLHYRVQGARVTWRGPLRHSTLGVEHEILIDCTWPRRLSVRVCSPPLIGREGQRIPHLYRDGSLCLNMAHEWSPQMLIAETIVPWISHWLFHYEIWVATGSWEGGGELSAGGKDAPA